MFGPPNSDGRFRPWPVKIIQPKAIEFYEEVVRRDGRSLGALSAATREAVPTENVYSRSLAMAMGAWHLYGRQSFHVSPTLVQALQDTSLRLVPSEALRAPFKACWVEAALTLRDDLPPFYGVFLLSIDSDDDHVFRQPVDQGILPADTRGFLAVAVGPHGMICVPQVYLCRDSLEESIEASLEIYRKTETPQGTTNSTSGIDPMSRTIWAFTANFLLYLSSPDPDLQPIVPPGLEKPPKSSKAREIQERVRRREGHVQAVGYRLTRIIKRATAAGGAQDESATHIVPHLVRGHWKRQSHGVGRVERKIIWVAPYRRGGDGTEERIERTYVV